VAGDFQLGCSAYFNGPVCNTIQPACISSSSSYSGVYVARDVVNDEKLLGTLEKVRTDFVPLAPWSPFALKMLKVIADCTTLWSGVTPNLERIYLLQQLSVSLWQSSAKIILRNWALQDDNFL